jgi:rubrerythrin
MQTTEITAEMIFQCFAAAQQMDDCGRTAESFVDVEEYENQIMYPEFARWAEHAGFPELAKLFRRVAGEEKLHAVWMRELYDTMGVPARGEDTQRAIDALNTIRTNCDALLALNSEGIVEKALEVAIRVEEREALSIYPKFRDRAMAEGNEAEAAVYQRVVDSEAQHAAWFKAALTQFPRDYHAAA